MVMGISDMHGSGVSDKHGGDGVKPCMVMMGMWTRD